MTESLRENAQFRKAKTPIIAKYADDHAKMMAEIAGRGFLALPGYAYDIENGLELTAKQGLSEINYKILAETIERELKQLGLDYNLAYKNATLAWEIEKQDLMTAWDAEYAGIKQGMASEEETLNLLAIEVGKRSITLLEAKTVIEEDMEALRKDLAELDGTTAPYEVQLANAKLLTAQRKLLIIPILQEIILKEQELLVAEQGKAEAYAGYMTAEQTLATKKGELTPFVNDLAVKVDQYATKITDEQIPKEGLIAAEKVAQSQAAVTVAEYKVDELTAEIAVETKNLDLMEAKRELQGAQFDDGQTLITKEKDLTDAFKDAQQSQSADLLGQESEAASALRDDKESVNDKRNEIKVTHATTIADAEKEAQTGLTALEVSKIERETNLKVAKEITASLKHLIG